MGEKILVVDDEPANLKLLDKMLRSQGYTNVVLVSDSRDALAQYQSGRPDLILLDINMPYLDGYQVIEQLKALNETLVPPIVVLTAQHSKDHILRALAAGARDFVSKPFDRNELLMRARNMLDAHLAHRLVQDHNVVLEAMVQKRTEELRSTRLQIVQCLGKAAEYRDEETGQHILRMSHTSALIASAVGWGESQCELMLNASPMHDIGKIAIPDAILRKPGKLEPHEWEIMKSHTVIGGQLLEGDQSDLIVMARDIAATHHEKWDGSGYPAGLSGESIPQAGRIAALADVFDALTSERPYKPSWSVDAAVELVRKNRGIHFDPELVDVFLRILPEVVKIRERFSEPDARP